MPSTVVGAKRNPVKYKTQCPSSRSLKSSWTNLDRDIKQYLAVQKNNAGKLRAPQRPHKKRELFDIFHKSLKTPCGWFGGRRAREGFLLPPGTAMSWNFLLQDPKHVHFKNQIKNHKLFGGLVSFRCYLYPILFLKSHV